MNRLIGTILILFALFILVFITDSVATNYPWFDANYRNQANLYIFQKKYTKSVDMSQKAVNLSPLDIRNVRQLLLANYYAGVNIDKKYQRQNVEVAKRLVDLSPTELLNWDLLGLVYLDLGNLEEAKKAFKKELVLSPNFVGVHLHMGEVLKQQGKINEAINYYNKAVQLSGGWDFAKKELEKAKKLLPQK